MLRIRPEQMEVLGAEMQRRFELRMVRHLRATFPEAIGKDSDADILAFVRLGIERAGEYKVVTEADVQRYLEYMVIYGPDFDSNPKTVWAGEILRSQEIDGSKKMDRIDEHDLFVMNRP